MPYILRLRQAIRGCGPTLAEVSARLCGEWSDPLGHSRRSRARTTTSAQYSFLGGNDRLICFRSRATAAAFFRLRFAVGVS